MQRLDGQLVLSPTDLTHHQECAHLTRLDLGVATGEWAAPDVETSDGAAARLRPRPRARAEVPGVAGGRRASRSSRSRRSSTPRDDAARRPRPSRRCAAASTSSTRARSSTAPGAGRPTSCSASRSRLRSSATGRTRSPTPSSPASSRSPRCCRWPPTPSGSRCCRGVAPEWIHVVTGDGESRPWRLIDVAAYARRARARLEAFVAAPPATGPVADRLLRAVPLGRAVQHRAAAGRRPRPGRRHARRPPGRAAGRRHRDAGRRWRRRRRSC